tara:strand:+ start:30127 stop:31221 length:1095 start_codon:yes stop_codon:yes gene_type:complete
MPKRSLHTFLREAETGKDKTFATYFSRSDQVLRETYQTLSEYLDAIHSDASIMRPYLSGQHKAIKQLEDEALREMGFTDENKAPADLIADVKQNVQNQILTYDLEKQKLSIVISKSQPFPEYDEQGKLQENRKQDCIDTVTRLGSHFKQQMVLKLAGELAQKRETDKIGIPVGSPDWNSIDETIKEIAMKPLAKSDIKNMLENEKNLLVKDILLARQQLNDMPDGGQELIEKEVLEGDYPQALKLAYFSANAYAALSTAANNQRQIKDNLDDPDTAKMFSEMYISYCNEAGRQMGLLQKIHQGPKLKKIEKSATRESYLLGRAINRLSAWGNECKAFFKNKLKPASKEDPEQSKNKNKHKRKKS